MVLSTVWSRNTSPVSPGSLEDPRKGLVVHVQHFFLSRIVQDPTFNMAAEGSSRCPGSPIPIRGLDGATNGKDASVDVHALLSSADASDQCTALEHALRFLDDPEREALAPRAVILVFGDDPDVTSTALALLLNLFARAVSGTFSVVVFVL